MSTVPQTYNHPLPLSDPVASSTPMAITIFFFFFFFFSNTQMVTPVSCAKIAVRRRSPRLPKSFLATGVSTVQI